MISPRPFPSREEGTPPPRLAWRKPGLCRPRPSEKRPAAPGLTAEKASGPWPQARTLVTSPGSPPRPRPRTRGGASPADPGAPLSVWMTPLSHRT
jgi:hypothetical protein